MRKVLGAALLLILATAGVGAAQSVVTVTAETVNLRAQATTDSAIVATVTLGMVLTVLGTTGNWYKVKDPLSGKEGYVHSLTVKAGGDARQPMPMPPPAPATKPAPAPPPTRTAKPAPARPPAAPPKDYSNSFSMVLARAGMFLASSSDFKAIYGTGPVVGAEVRIGLPRPGGPIIVGWLEVNSRQRTGKLSFTEESTKVSVTAIEAGALYRFNTGRTSPYAGAGLGYYMLTETNEPLGEATASKLGFCAVGGVSTTVSRRFVADARLKYSFVTMSPAGESVKAGGLTLGVGVGIKF
jgi:opacity protein-like surface antigen